jgi:hypothetical protein
MAPEQWTTSDSAGRNRHLVFGNWYRKGSVVSVAVRSVRWESRVELPQERKKKDVATRCDQGVIQPNR